MNTLKHAYKEQKQLIEVTSLNRYIKLV